MRILTIILAKSGRKSLPSDIEKIKLEGGLDNIELSPPFPGSMLTAAWKKTS